MSNAKTYLLEVPLSRLLRNAAYVTIHDITVSYQSSSPHI